MYIKYNDQVGLISISISSNIIDALLFISEHIRSDFGIQQSQLQNKRGNSSYLLYFFSYLSVFPSFLSVLVTIILLSSVRLT